MKQTILWFDRKFAFDHLKGTFPSIYERLDGLMLRLEHKLRAIAREHQQVKIDGKWSVKEHLGHLLDLEELWIARMRDFLNNEVELSPADLENRRTHEANHNDSDLGDLLQALRTKRAEFLSLCRQLEKQAETLTALHPRLKQPMRVIDLAYFVAEHDDHHLAAITEIQRQLVD
ncbi:MAG: DinB family protein [Roseivirga sp.]|nr:DinB family protein [Roseivirga sp.]